jgi:hypothetical protein
MPGFFYAHAALAAVLGQLGQLEAAHKAVQELLDLRPDFAAVATPGIRQVVRAPRYRACCRRPSQSGSGDSRECVTGKSGRLNHEELDGPESASGSHLRRVANGLPTVSFLLFSGWQSSG